jgi:hypothetical protein
MSARVAWLGTIGLAAVSIAVADWLIAGVLSDAVKRVAPDRLMEWFDVFVLPSTLAPAIWGSRLVAAGAVGFWLAAAIDRTSVVRVAIAAGLVVIAVETGMTLMLGREVEVLTPLVRLACLVGGAAIGLRWPLRDRARHVVTRVGAAVLVVGLIANIALVPSLWRPIRLVAFQRITLPICLDGRLVAEGRSLLGNERYYEVAGNITPQAVADCYRQTIAAGWDPVTPESVERGVILDGIFGQSWRDPETHWRLTLFVSIDTVPQDSPSWSPFTPGQRTVHVTLEAPGYPWTPVGATPPVLLSSGTP